jgi:acyl-coenzyme A thioesterase PaaI-like protein
MAQGRRAALMSQGYFSKLAFGPRGVRLLMNLWPPFRGMGVKVREIAPDFRRARVELRMRLLNRNYVGTHFGGSMFAMADPFHMVLMMHVLGSDYVVWDKAGSIRFLKPGRGTLTAEFEITQAMVDEAKARTAGGEKFEPTYAVELKDPEGTVVATVEKTLHIRRKK